MFNDPIVKEVRRAGERLARQADYNLHTFFRNLRNNEDKDCLFTRSKSLFKLKKGVR